MKKVTMKALNDYIQTKYNPNYGIERGEGYFYFYGSEIPSIYCFSLHQMTLDQWKEAIDDAINSCEVYQ